MLKCLKSSLCAALLCTTTLACQPDGSGGDEGMSGETGDTDPTDTEGTGDDGQLTLDNCEESVASDAGEFYQKYFACVDVSVIAGATVIASEGLPPHPSPYYPADHPNFVPFDDRGGTHNKNPGEIGGGNFSIEVPDNPVAKGITIDQSIVDNTMMTSAEEYGGGGVGMALNGVNIFAAMARPGDFIADEAFTFDLYEGHPAGTTYHYHFQTPGPLEVLESYGIANSGVPGEADIELYGIMCDGTVVLGCTELDGAEPSSGDFDAQNGHVHDLGDGTTTFFSGRYHTHVCPQKWPDYPYFPEIAYYETTSCPVPGPMP